LRTAVVSIAIVVRGNRDSILWCIGEGGDACDSAARKHHGDKGRGADIAGGGAEENRPGGCGCHARGIYGGRERNVGASKDNRGGGGQGHRGLTLRDRDAQGCRSGAGTVTGIAGVLRGNIVLSGG